MKKLLLSILLLALCGSALAQNAFRIRSDSTGSGSAIMRPAPTYIAARVLAANTSEAHTVPPGVSRVIFSANCNFYAIPGATAVVPAADVTDGTASELNPGAWDLIAGVATIALIAPTACIVTLTFYL